MNLTRIPDSIFYNENYFSEEVLRQGKKGLIFINITRGEIAPEAGLLHLYQEGIIGGIGLDVFTAENDFSQSLRNQKTTSDENLLAARRLLEWQRTERPTYMCSRIRHSTPTWPLPPRHPTR